MLAKLETRKGGGGEFIVQSNFSSEINKILALSTSVPKSDTVFIYRLYISYTMTYAVFVKQTDCESFEHIH